MAEAKSRLPAIAIALAVIAIGMLALAIYTRAHRSDNTAAVPADALPIDASPPPIDAPEIDASEPDAGSALVAPDPNGCTPCSRCAPTRCKCADGVLSSSLQCVNGCCVPPAETCSDTCKPHGGVAGP